MKKILLAVNFESESDAAIEDAYLLASKYNGAIIPVHAVEYLPQSNKQHEIDLLMGQIDKRMKEISERLEIKGLKVYEPVIEKGDPVSVIESACEVIEPDVLIIGAGTNDANHKTLGVTAKSIVRTSKIPVWISNIAADKLDYTSIICPVDLSEHSLTTLKTAVIISKTIDAKLHILHVEPKVTAYPGLMSSDIPVSPWVLSETMMEMKSEEEYNREHEKHVLNHDLKDFVEQVDLSGIDYDLHVKSGKASREILAFVPLFEAGLLVMGTMGKTGVVRKLLGGTVEKVLDQLPCSMLCVPHEQS